MEEFLAELTTKFNWWFYFALLMVGLYAMIAKRNLVKKMVGLGIFQAAIMLFYVSIGAKKGGTIPILMDKGAANPDLYDNPLPHVLMLTAIVVGVATLGVGLALLQRIYMRYKTLDEDEILEAVERES